MNTEQEQNKLQNGILYIVPTPIGNMNDVSPRAIKTLGECDFVAAEDTRVGGKLLMLLGIKKPLVSYHEHTDRHKIDMIAERILSGETCALITDAGTPAVSDPGEKLVKACAERDITVVPLPGPCAAITALSASGLESRRFCFEGFLPEKGVQEYLDEIKAETRTMIFYAAPHDLIKVIQQLHGALSDRKCVLAKELTKLNECFLRTTLSSLESDVLSRGEAFLKGEFIIIVEGAKKDENDWNETDIPTHVKYYLSMGLSKMDACKQVARDRKVSKSVIYKIVSELDEI